MFEKGLAVGASVWHYSVPFQDDIAGALEQLRAAVYERGEYYRQEPNPTAEMTEDEYRATLNLDDDPSGIHQFLLEEWLKAKERPIPVDADTLVAAQPESGTHSIIDICEGVSEWPDMCTASPLTAEQLQEFFATERPTTVQVREWMSIYRIGEIRDRWSGAYVVSYSAAGEPEQIHFTGFSGD